MCTCANRLGIFALSVSVVVVKRGVGAILELILGARMEWPVAGIRVLIANSPTSDDDIRFVISRLSRKDRTKDKKECTKEHFVDSVVKHMSFLPVLVSNPSFSWRSLQ